MPSLLLVVEGYGEVDACKALVRRILAERYGIHTWNLEVHRRGGIDHLKGRAWTNFERYLLAAYKEQMPILWAVDNDAGDCASSLVAGFYDRINKVGIRQPTAFCFWKREFETMFLYDPAAIARRLGIENMVPKENWEDLRGVKEHLNKHLPRGRCYKETIDQVAITALLDLEKVASGYGCFRHFERVLLWLIQQTKPALYPLQSAGM